MTSMADQRHQQEPLLTPGEVAALFRVEPKTVTRWAAKGRIASIRTPGGHRRIPQDAVDALLKTAHIALAKAVAL